MMGSRRAGRLSSSGSRSSLSSLEDSYQSLSGDDDDDEDCLSDFSGEELGVGRRGRGPEVRGRKVKSRSGSLFNDVKVILRKHDRKLLKVEEDVNVLVRWLNEKFGFILKQGSISSVIATDASGLIGEDFDLEGGAGDADANDVFYEDNADGSNQVLPDEEGGPTTPSSVGADAEIFGGLQRSRVPLPDGDAVPSSDYEAQTRLLRRSTDANETAGLVREVVHTSISSARPAATARPQRQKQQRTFVSRPRRIKDTSSHPPGQCQCDICGKFLKDPNSLRQHKKIHLDIRPFTCPEPNCGKKFRRKFHLQTHSLIHKGVKKHQCGYCGRLFLLQKDLVPHEKIHTGDRPFKCRECPKEFILKSHLVMHERIHSGEKPYKCDICSKCFSQSNSLRLHKMKVHKELNSASSAKVSKPKKKSKITPRRRKVNQGSSLTGSIIDPSHLGASTTPAPGKLPLYRSQGTNLNLSSFPHIPSSSASSPLVTFMQQQYPLPMLRSQHIEIFEPMNVNLNPSNSGGIFLSPASIIDGVSILSSGDPSTAFINSDFSEIP